MTEDGIKRMLAAFGNDLRDSINKSIVLPTTQSLMYLNDRMDKEIERAINADMLLHDRVEALEAKIKELSGE